MRKHYDVLIVGCGPSGATLANLLRLRGHSVGILDREKEIFRAPRAMTIDAETCRVFQWLGVQERLEKEDARPFVRHLFVDQDRRILLDVDFGLVEGSKGYPAAGVRFHQPSLERFLRDDFTKDQGVDAFLGFDVLNVDGEGPHATLTARHTETGETYTLTAQYIIGADGGDSLCRKYIDSPRRDFNYSRKWIVIDIVLHDHAEWDKIDDMSEFRCQEDSAIVYVKGFHGHVRFDFEVTEEQAENFTEADAIEMMSEYIDTSSVEFQRLAPYHFYAGMPAEWRRGRVLIAGDAAHLTSPFSGQGLNMGIRDAANLAFKLGMVLDGQAGERLLDTYQEERWENCEKVIKGATQRGLMISAGDPWGRFKRWFGFWVGRNAPKIGLAAMSKSSVGFPYQDGLIGAHDAAGHQFPQPLVKSQNGEELLLDHLLGDRFVILALESAQSSLHSGWFENTLGGKVCIIGKDVIDHTGKLVAYFEKHDIEAILLRPDKYIFEAGRSVDALRTSLQVALSSYAPPHQVTAA